MNSTSLIWINKLISDFFTIFDGATSNLLIFAHMMLLVFITWDFIMLGYSWLFGLGEGLKVFTTKVIAIILLSILLSDAMYTALKQGLLYYSTKAAFATMYTDPTVKNGTTVVLQKEYQALLKAKSDDWSTMMKDDNVGYVRDAIAAVNATRQQMKDMIMALKSQAETVKDARPDAWNTLRHQSMLGLLPGPMLELMAKEIESSYADINQYQSIISPRGYFNPSYIWAFAYVIGAQIDAKRIEYSQPQGINLLGDLGSTLAMWVLWFFIMVCSIIFIAMYMIVILEFNIYLCFGVLLIPLGLLKQTKNFAERFLGGVISSSLKYIVTLGIIFIFFSYMSKSGVTLFKGTSGEIMSLLFSFGFFAFIMIKLPDLVGNLVSGSASIGNGLGQVAKTVQNGVQHAQRATQWGQKKMSGGIENAGEFVGASAKGFGKGSTDASNAYSNAGGGWKGVMAGAGAGAKGFAGSMAKSGLNKAGSTLVSALTGKKPDGSAGGQPRPGPGNKDTSNRITGEGGGRGNRDAGTTANASGRRDFNSRNMSSKEAIQHAGIKNFVKDSFQHGKQDGADKEKKDRMGAAKKAVSNMKSAGSFESSKPIGPTVESKAQQQLPKPSKPDSGMMLGNYLAGKSPARSSKK